MNRCDAESLDYHDLDDASAKQVIDAMDANRDGHIDFDDFLSWYTRYTASPEEDSAAASIFRLLRRYRIREADASALKAFHLSAYRLWFPCWSCVFMDA